MSSHETPEEIRDERRAEQLRAGGPMTVPPSSATIQPAASALPATLADPWLRRLLSGIVAAMTGVVTVVALLAFTASFGAIHTFALRSGGIAPGHAWMAPLFVDCFLFVGACGDLWCALTRTGPGDGLGWERLADWAPKLLLVASAAASYGLNIAHAPPTGPARTVAALPPTALVVTEVVLMVIARRAARYRALRLTGAAQPQQTAQPGLADPARSVAGRDLHAETRRLVAAWQAHGRQVTSADLARQLGTSPRHGRRLLAAHRAVEATANGQQPSQHRRMSADDRAGAKRPIRQAVEPTPEEVTRQ